MIQPISRETAIALAKEAGMAGMLTDVVCSLEEIHRLCNLAVAHSRKDADKLLQQAQEAVLDEHLPGFTEDAPRQHDDIIYDKAIEDAADAIQQLIARTYLEGKK